MISELFRRLHQYSIVNNDAIIFKSHKYTYKDLLSNIKICEDYICKNNIAPGQVISIISDYSIESISLLLALAKRNAIILPISSRNMINDNIFYHASIEYIIDFENGSINLEKLDVASQNSLLLELKNKNHPGIIFLSSGSSGKPKAILHNLNNLLSKYQKSEKKYRTLAFLLFDHIAGIDTLFYTLFAGGTLIIPEKRDPVSVLMSVQDFNVEVLSVSPSFLNLMLYSINNLTDFDLSSLKIITFGSEKMSEMTLNKLKQILPQDIKLIQKYGTTEFGSPISKSNKDNPLLIKFDKDNCDYKILDSHLYIKTGMSMMGYLTGENIIIKDGWIDTGDLVEVHDDWISIIGRESDIINVGGQKVFPSEIESLLLEIDIIQDVMAFSVPNTILGNVVGIQVSIKKSVPLAELKKIIRNYCFNKLESYKLPVYIEIVDSISISDRYKKIRKKNQS